jgi:hypothetical protein
VWGALLVLLRFPSAPVAEQGAHVAPKEAATTKAASRKKNAPKAKKGAKKANERGATMAAIAKSTGSQNHTIRRFSSNSRSAAFAD